MPVTTSPILPRLADAAVSARVGADLYRFTNRDQIPDTSLAKNGDGTFTITGIDFLKAGTFNGLGLLEVDLEAMVGHFVQLRDAGIFLPPFRLDHSWSVLSVIGWIENLETYRRVDATDSMEKTFLRGDVRLTGSVDYTPDQIVKAIKSGSLRNRSSELGYYVTNSGVELPLVFYGCAFVDIPAVEGLSPVSLSKVRLSTPHTITALNADDEETPGMLDETTTPDETPEGTVDESTTPETPDETTPDEVLDDTTLDESDDEEAEEAPDLSDVDDVIDGDLTDGEEDDASSDDADELGTGDSASTPESPTGGDLSRRLEEANAEIRRLRSESANREISRFREAGVIVAANETAATALLSHDDPEVRRSAGIILGHVGATVRLGTRRGKTTLTPDNTAGGSDVRIEIGMTKDEVSDLWANLTPEDRKAGPHRVAYDAWRKDRADNGVRD